MLGNFARLCRLPRRVGYSTVRVPPPMQHKITSDGGLSMEAGFQPTSVEKGWYEWWKQEGFFQFNPKKNQTPFTMLIPPPNVTGKLHIGHALTLSIQDAVARYHRMCGRHVSWIPGTDHAGIGTQSLVEKKLKQEQGVTKHDLSRDEFMKELWEFKEQHGNAILNQLMRLGASVDWDRQFFTLDEGHSRAVVNAFIQLHRQKLIYRDVRIVNWCPALETAISDIEVEHASYEKPTFVSVPGFPNKLEIGVLYHVAYPVEGGELVVATSRPETILGDVALAVHPEDERYRHLIGTQAHHPLIPGRLLPIIGDAELVDPQLGTGVVKVTPAHDAADFACSQRNRLPPPPSILDTKGNIVANPHFPSLAGLHRFEARTRIVDLLDAGGYFRGKVASDKPTVVARCSRSGDIIEPWLRPQWFVRMTSMAELALRSTESLSFYPQDMAGEFKRWLLNIQDWCVSRQLVWGHRIPAYQAFCSADSEPAWHAKINQQWFAADSEKAAFDEIRHQLAPSSKEQVDAFISKVELRQDEDVLDTWFSSGLLPLSVAGWRKPGDVVEGYPSQLLETGSDILFFWVARMVMLCSHLAALPFEKVLLHPIIRDRNGRKMSKSVGNVIDPIHVIDGISLAQLQAPLASSLLPHAEVARSLQALASEFPNGIPACGVDALRFSLLSYLQQGRQINLNLDNVVSASHFANKLWNVVRFYLQKRGEIPPPLSSDLQAPRALSDRYLLSKTAQCIEECHAAMAGLELHRVPEAIRKLTVATICDTWVEFSRPALAKPEGSESLSVLGVVLDIVLRLSHPIMPFVSETLWHHLHYPHPPPTPSLMIAEYPTQSLLAKFKDPEAEAHFQLLVSVLHGARSLRQSNKISIKHPLDFKVVVQDLGSQDKPCHQLLPWLDSQGPVALYKPDIMRLSNMSSFSIEQQQQLPSTGFLQLLEASDQHSITLLATTHNSDQPALHANFNRLSTKLQKLKEKRDTLFLATSDANYSTRVPKRVQDINSHRLAEMDSDIASLQANLDQIAAFKH
ncbi:hypothetical protein DSO57_1038804 [Entomophthora muscae]|uniref:Uncharacterized protein n=1 Tax=Entomophthora muscae TaxID=34485 RepID=A0ACC2SYV4_9FUNG|nr:hypothetical protein DSO57_1038804 [Entomophthora muscae]